MAPITIRTETIQPDYIAFIHRSFKNLSDAKIQLGIRDMRIQRWYEIFRGDPCRLEDVYKIEHALEVWAKTNGKLDDLMGVEKPSPEKQLLVKIWRAYLLSPDECAGLKNLEEEIRAMVGTQRSPLKVEQADE